MAILYGIAAALLTALIAIRSRAWLTKAADGDAGALAMFRQVSGNTIDVRSGALDLNTMDKAAVHRAATAINHTGISKFKRATDIAASLGLVLFLAPLLALTVLAIKLDSRGPVLYRQKRVGYAGRCFSVFKFRSMRMNAEQNGPQYAAIDDDRVTRVGRFIRKTRIDEIPQTINVLRGEMSFVGPRPERPEFVAELEREIPHYHSRHLVKPGITGWAQVRYEYAATVEGAREKLRYDLFYIRNFTPLMDVMIILMTIRVALFGIGSR